MTDVHDFVPLVVQMGGELGYGFTEADVQEAMGASRRAWLERWIV